MEKITTLEDLLCLKLQALYDIESEILKFLPTLAKNATHVDLKREFEEETIDVEKQINRLKEAFALMREKPRKTKVEGIRGIISDIKWLIKNIKDKMALDASLIAASSYIEHYEIAGYTSAIDWARFIGQEKISGLLAETLKSERRSARKLERLAVEEIDAQVIPDSNKGRKNKTK